MHTVDTSLYNYFFSLTPDEEYYFPHENYSTNTWLNMYRWINFCCRDNAIARKVFRPLLTDEVG